MLADVQCQSTAIPSSTEHTASLKVDSVFLMNFYLELSLIDAILFLEMVKGYLRIDAKPHQKKLMGLK